MSESFIPASEFETASNAVSNILGQPVEEIKITDILPPLNDIADSNKVFKGKLSVLFVDMRKSTDLTDELKSKKMVKVYRSFIRIVIQAIRYSGGYTRQFAGDGIMGIFQNSNVDDQNISSSCKAIKAARYIHTLIDFCLNPALKKSMDICIGCGVGICTGTIMITKVGMRGKESNKTAENETGIVWVGSTTNYANRYCSLAHPCEIFIDENTYSEIEDSEIWTKTSRTKGNKVFEGYAVSEHYLSLPEEITAEAVKADTQLFQQLFYLADHKYGGSLPVPVHFLMDEFSNVSLPEDFSKILAVMRSRNVYVSIILQNVAALKALFEKEWESILGNCDEFLYLGGNETSTHKLISESYLGKSTIDTNTYGKSSGRNGNYSTNYQISGRELLTPDEVRMLDNRYALLFIRGERPVMDEKYDILKHPNIALTEDGGAAPYEHGGTENAVATLSFAGAAAETLFEFNEPIPDYELLSDEDIEALF